MNYSNPFVAGQMLRNTQLFIGRKEELRAIVNRMTGSQPTSLNFVGEHQIGKSSLLYHFCLTWKQRVTQPERYVVIFLSLKSAICQKEENFYQAVAQKLLSCSSLKKHSGLVELLQNKSLNRFAFSQAIEEFKQQGLLPVLCLDDFDSLFNHRNERRKEFDNGFYDNLRALMDDSALMLVLTTAKELEVYGKEYRFVSSFFNVGHVIKLRELTTDEAIKLTRLPENKEKNIPAYLTIEQQNLAQQWGNRHPYFLQLAGYYLWEAGQNGEDIECARRRFYNQINKKNTDYSKWVKVLLFLIVIILCLVILQYLGFDIWNSIKSVIDAVGGIVKGIGKIWDEIIKISVGLITFILLILFMFKIVTWEEFKEFMRNFLFR